MIFCLSLLKIYAFYLGFVLFQHIVQRNLPHPVFCRFLNIQVKIPQNQLNIYSYTAGGVGMGVLVEQGFISLYRPICVQ